MNATASGSPLPASPTLANVRDLAPALSERAAAIEAARRLPPGVLADLTSAGCFRMLLPKEYGGDELRVDQALAVVEELSRADGSTGWNVMIAASNIIVFSLFPADTFRAVYADGPDVISAGSHAPKGTATVAAGGYLIRGQWPFASGCEHSSWLITHSRVVTGEGAPVLDAGGAPELRLALTPVRDAEVVDTWQALGLRGTGSHDVRLDGVLCPPERTCRLFGGAPTVPGTVFEIPSVAQLGLFIAAVALGIAGAALDDVAAVARAGKRAAYGGQRLAAAPLFQHRLGEADASLRAARALLYADAAEMWHLASAGHLFSLLDRARLRATSSRVVAVAAEVVDVAYRCSGSVGVYDGASVQRHLRDMYTITQHAGVGPEFYALAGGLLAGEAIDSTRI